MLCGCLRSKFVYYALMVLVPVLAFVVYLFVAMPGPCVPVSKVGGPAEPAGRYDDDRIPLLAVYGFHFNTLPWVRERLAWLKDTPIFRCNPGYRSVAFGDATSMRYLTSAPETEVSRETGLVFTIATPGYWREAGVPTALSRGEDHKNRRELWKLLLDQRGMDMMFAAIQTAIKDAIPIWNDRIKEKGKLNYLDAWNGLVNYVAVQFMFGTRFSEDDFLKAAPTILGISSHDKLTNALADLIVDKSRDLPTRRIVDRFMTLMMGTTAWKDVVEKYAKDFNIPESNLKGDFLPTVFINAVGPTYLSLQHFVPFLAGHPKIRAKIKAEIRDVLKGEPMTYDNIHKLEYLDAVVHEFHRFRPQPTIAGRVAMSDFEVPTSTGDKYQVREGERLVGHQLFAMYDKKIFGEDTEDVNPNRFVNNPELKEWTNLYYAGGVPNTGLPKKNSFDCVAGLGPGAGALPNGTAKNPYGDQKGGYVKVMQKYLLAIFADLIEFELDGTPDWDGTKDLQRKMPWYISWFMIPKIWQKIAPLNLVGSVSINHNEAMGTWKLRDYSVKGRLRVKVGGASNVPNYEPWPFSVNPFVELQVCDDYQRTSIKRGDNNPQWDERFDLQPYVWNGTFSDVLFIRVFNKHLMMQDELIGDAKIPLFGDNPIVGYHTITLYDGGAKLEISILDAIEDPE